MNENGTNIMENEYVKELFGILKENGKDTSGLNALIGQLKNMENFVKLAEDRITDMKAQLDNMREIQNHPIKTALKNAITALEMKIAEIKVQITELKNNIIDGCKNAVKAFKEKGIAALDKIASFFRIKKGLQAIKTNISAAVNNCDKSVTKIESFSQEYHKAGRHFKNMARVIVGKQPIDKVKESGKLAKTFSAPYRAHKTCLLGIQKAVNVIVNKLEQLEQNAETKRGERAAAKIKKPTLMQRLEANKEKIKQAELEKPVLERAPKSKGLEV